MSLGISIGIRVGKGGGGAVALKDMEFSISLTEDTTAGKRLTLPLANGFSYNCTVDWGDGSSNTVTAYNDTDRIHNYSTIGDYDVKITGLCEYFRVNDNAEDKGKYVSINNFNSAIGLKELDFFGCSNITSITSTLSNVSTLLKLINGFRGTGISSVPAGIFDGCVNLVDVTAVFRDCTGVSTIPAHLLDNNVALTDVSEIFMGCHNITSIPSGFLDYNTELTGICGAFYDMNISSIPSGLLDHNTKVVIGAAFGYNANLTSIPTGLYRYCTEMTNVSYAFRNCTSLTSIPSDLFQYNTKLVLMSYIFYGCTNITSIPSTLFDNIVDSASGKLTAAFQNCTSLTGAAPAVWDDLPSFDGSYCFSGCTGLSNYPIIPEEWGGNAPDTDATNYIARFDSAPSETLGRLLNSLFVDLKSNGIYGELDQFVLMNLNTAANSKLNIKGNTIPHVWVGSPTWNAKSGVTMANGKYVKSGFIPASSGTKFTKDDCGIIFGLTGVTGATYHGVYNLDNTPDYFCYICNYDYRTSQLLNSAATHVFTKELKEGFNFWARTSSTQVAVRTGGTEETISSASDAIPTTAEYYIGACNAYSGGGDHAEAYMVGSVFSYYGFGSKMDATKRAKFQQIMDKFCTDIQTAW